MSRAFSLLEMLTVIGISVFLLAVVFPTFVTAQEESRFRSFAAKFTGHLAVARQVAQQRQVSVRLEFPGDEVRYRADVWDGDSPKALFLEPMGSGYERDIRLQLPSQSLERPSGTGTLDRAFSSTHRPQVVFAPRGASNATLVLSDGRQRTLCAVISSQTGRFRVYLHTPRTQGWQVFF